MHSDKYAISMKDLYGKHKYHMSSHYMNKTNLKFHFCHCCYVVDLSCYASHSIMQIYLSGNPWHCDVRLSWIHRQRSPERLFCLFNYGDICLSDSKAVKCTSPPALSGMQISDPSEFCTVFSAETWLK